jgi:hypothetical protein
MPSVHCFADDALEDELLLEEELELEELLEEEEVVVVLGQSGKSTI